MSDENDDSPAATRIGRHRAVYLTAAVTGLLALVAGFAVVARVSSSAPSSTAALSQTPATLRIAARAPITTAPVTTPAVTPASPTSGSVGSSVGSSVAAPTTQSSTVADPPTVRRPDPVTTPSIQLLPAVTATLPLPAVYGADVIDWTAPFSLQIASGHTAALAVTAHNPTDRPATLPHPLSCTPRINEDEICTQNVQLLGAGQSASASYVIDAHGVAPGLYTLRIEGVLTISVTVS